VPIRKFDTEDAVKAAWLSLFPYTQRVLPGFEEPATQRRLIEIAGERTWAIKRGTQRLFENCRQARFEKLLQICQDADMEVNWYEGYAEPGYDDPEFGVLTGNWNDKTRWNPKTKTSELIDSTPSRVAALFEKFGGVELEWEDEWYGCEDCNKLIRTSADSMCWRPSYAFVGDCTILCADCLARDPEDLLESLAGTDKPLEIGSIDLEEHGWLLVDELESWDWDINSIVKALADVQIDRFLLCSADNSVWICGTKHRGQVRAAKAAIENREMDLADYLGDLHDSLVPEATE